ncbi:MAG: hypothetical protein KME60_22085 [Cyanomargarita calcarea GSE-NOS-MK-12-04C]|jgi:hypothetical protein|uniref:Menaquinone-specific isochorismate synthase n=1 Tax=Cyanomargarita calcarea GSE-NOS-MK-12-04C TaxID=2839659 RepID=A0A951QQD2_9CYAN|nr:hypothetical protein [Cyanomargarita calcarea GSE-NOS-MK-12-04C]
MTKTTQLQTILQAIKEAPQKVINFILVPVSRIFSPRDDDYPESGVQPFEGKTDKKKHH